MIANARIILGVAALSVAFVFAVTARGNVRAVFIGYSIFSAVLGISAIIDALLPRHISYEYGWVLLVFAGVAFIVLQVTVILGMLYHRRRAEK